MIDAVAAPTAALVAADADEVSAQIAALFSAHSRAYQTLSVEAAAFHERFVRAKAAAAGGYAAAEAANASPQEIVQQQLLGAAGVDGSTRSAPHNAA